MSLNEEIRREGMRLGFARIGYALSREHPAAARLRQWLDRGYEGDMRYLARRVEERGDPAKLAPWSRSLILASFPYPGSDAPTPPGVVRISRYARGRDYHAALKQRLADLGGRIAQLAPGARCSPVADTGALLEKPWGVRAGLGWQGKHTNLIDPEGGSWFFVGELLTDLELEPDAPEVTDRCGSCTRCLEACPTEAFPEPYVLDARRCISYLTIEHKGSIPAPLRAAMGNHVFGCDICQEVCPWNDAAPNSAEEGAHEAIPAADLLALTREQFNRRFAGTALRRTGWSRVLRNAAVALGNSDDPEAIEPLRQALRIPDPLVREHVRWALDRLGDSRSSRPEAQLGSPA
ncbi:MAG TPA: tRNA epoxyqueuosine(34) reductase QueG [Candidatus Polarisedimenticolia bacterium]|nr:tRNA epoxyqueuosine(34) reductase QueG [Candidatus Polarisedimenticolia bacterium]